MFRFFRHYKDIHHLIILDNFDVDLSVIFVTFQTRSWSTYLVRTILFKEYLDPFETLQGFFSTSISWTSILLTLLLPVQPIKLGQCQHKLLAQ